MTKFETETKMMRIELLTRSALTPEIQKQVVELYRQLNDENRQRSMAEVLDPSNKVVVAICLLDKTLVGMALLSTYTVISGYRGLVEDVIVDQGQRGQGIGRQLMECLLSEAKTMGLDEVLLFTGHHRKPAISLYTRLGFTLRQSGLYQLRLP